MRTTLSIDDDVLRAVKDRAQRESRTVGEVLSELARNALTGRVGDDRGLPAARPGLRDGFAVLPARGGLVTTSLVRELLDEDD